MGAQCSRPSNGTPTRGLLKHLNSEDKEPRGHDAALPLPSSGSSACEESDCDSIGNGALSSSESGASDGSALRASPSPCTLNESRLSASLWHAQSRAGRSFETASGKSFQRGNRRRSRLLTHSLPDRTDAEDEQWRVPRKLPTTTNSAAISLSQLQSAASRRCKPQGTCSRQSDSIVLVANPPSPDAQTQLDEPVRRMFLEFYHRNRKEQRRHEQALKAASRAVDRSVASCPPFASAVSLETIQEKSPVSPVPGGTLARQEAEVLAVKALDVFSPDERYTRLEEFLVLVNAIQDEYQSERHRGRAIRGPNRASTFSALHTPPERD